MREKNHTDAVTHTHTPTPTPTHTGTHTHTWGAIHWLSEFLSISEFPLPSLIRSRVFFLLFLLFVVVFDCRLSLRNTPRGRPRNNAGRRCPGPPPRLTRHRSGVSYSHLSVVARQSASSPALDWWERVSHCESFKWVLNLCLPPVGGDGAVTEDDQTQLTNSRRDRYKP